jgi:hypothetical protein
MVDKVLTKNPDDRPSASQLLKTSYVSSVLKEFVSQTLLLSALPPPPPSTGGVQSSVDSVSHRRSLLESDEQSSTLTQVNINKLNVQRSAVMTPCFTRQLPPIAAVHRKGIKLLSPVDSPLETTDYEDDFEADEPDQVSSSADEEDVKDAGEEVDGRDCGKGAECRDLDSSFSNEYCDDFEEYSSEQEMEEVLSCAKVVQQQKWKTNDDITITDGGPVDIRQFLKPHCEAAVGKDRFDAIVTKTGGIPCQYGMDVFVKSSTDQICYFIEELYGAGDDDGS